MRFLYTILPLLSAVAFATDLEASKCVDKCPKVKCAADDAAALCKCVNDNEDRCKKICPKYKPSYIPCPSPTPTPKPISTSLPSPTPITASKCECLKIACLQVWPGSCYCANAAKQRCYDDCGGPKPQLQECPPMEVEARAPEPEVVARAPEPEVVARAPEPAVEAKCECEQVFCVLSFPEGCYCQNAAAETCAKKCGTKATLQDCGPPVSSKTFTTKVKSTAKSTPKFTPKPTPTPKPTKTKTPKATPTPVLPPNPHKVCGGGRANYNLCDEGYTCIDDPYTPGCGPACDGLGICVRQEGCGGFVGRPCEEKGQLCLDQEYDGCDPMNGGADCMGWCVWPHRSLYES